LVCEPEGDICTPNVRKESDISILGTVVLLIESPVVRSIDPGVIFVSANDGIPFLHTQAIRYQKLFCIFMAPPVENNNLSQCWAIVVMDCVVVVISFESFVVAEISGFLM
jgi:hypothetical protein